MIDLQFISQEDFARLESLPIEPVEKTALFADFCRLNTLSMVMFAGSGHLGSSFSAMEIASWIYRHELGENGIYFSSKGHDAPGLYSILIGLGRLDESLLKKLRRLGGLPGHPDVGTPGMACNTGSLGMGISKAKGMIQAARLDGKTQPCFVLTGDGELQEGQIWESLGGAAIHKMGELTVVVDHNKIQSDTLVKWVSDLGDLETKFKAFGWETARCSGHDLTALREVFEKFKTITNRPKILIADTLKGGGVSFMEAYSPGKVTDLYKFHSGAPSQGDYGAALDELRQRLASKLPFDLAFVETKIPPRTPPVGQRLVAAYGKKLVELAETNPNVVVLDGDLMLDCGLIPFQERFPERFIECGIAEQDMVSQAGGLALSGKLPIVHSFACFLTPRANEHIYNNATERTKVIYTGSLAGLVPGAPGHSHQSVRDIAILGQIPGLTLIEPCCEQEAAAALDFAVNANPGSTYIRLVSIPVDIPFALPENHALTPGRGTVLTSGQAAVIIGYGPVLLTEAWHAAERHGSVKLINLPWLNNVNPDWLREQILGFNRILLLDNHLIHGGQGDMLCRTVAELRLPNPPELIRLGVNSIPRCGQNAEVLKAHGLDRDSIYALF